MHSRTAPPPVSTATALRSDGDAELPESVQIPCNRGRQAWSQAHVFNRLALVPCAVVSVEELIDAVYGATPDGGPVNAIFNVRVAIYRLRQRGLRIETVHGRGYVLSGSQAVAPPVAPARKLRLRPRLARRARSGRLTAVAAAEVGEEHGRERGAQPDPCIAGAKFTG